MARVRMSEEELWAFVTEAHTGIMTTLRRDGVPIALPLWFSCLDRRIYARTRGKKLQRIAHDPRSSFLVESGRKWGDLRAVHLTGLAEIVDLDAELSERFLGEMDRKYAGFRAGPDVMPRTAVDHYARAVGGVIRFTPDGRALTWDNRKLAE